MILMLVRQEWTFMFVNMSWVVPFVFGLTKKKKVLVTLKMKSVFAF